MKSAPSTDTTKPTALYVWLVPSESVLEQPGSWRIRKWDTEPFPEANFQCVASETRPTRDEVLEEALNCYSPDDTATDWADKIRALKNAAPQEHPAVNSASRQEADVSTGAETATGAIPKLGRESVSQPVRDSALQPAESASVPCVEVPLALVVQLAQVAKKRFHSAMLEGMTEQAAFEEIIRFILEEAFNG